MHIAQVILLLLVIVVAGVGVWLWFTGFATQTTSTSPALGGGLKVEAVSARDSELYIYVRNVGDVSLTLDKVYIWDSKGRLVAVYNATTLGLLVWGGDVWNVSGSMHLVERGLIFYDGFDGNSLNTNLWEVRANKYAERTELSVSNGHLKVAVASRERNKWATYGVFTRSPVSLPDSYVFEVELVKKGRAYWRYAVCLYIMSQNDNNNPYYNTPWLAAKLYYKRSDRETWARIAYRDGGQKQVEDVVKWWGDVEARARIIVVVEKGYAKRAIVWKMYKYEGEDEWRRYSSPSDKQLRNVPAVKGNVYLALTVDNPTTFRNRGWFDYVKIYKSTSFTLVGLKPDAEYKLVGSRGECTVTADTTALTIDPLNPPSGCEWLQEEYFEHGYPLKITLGSEEFGKVEPHELKTLVFKANLPPGTYTLQVTAREGVAATATLLVGGG